MKTKDLLVFTEAELSSELKHMKLKELEKHAKNITSSLGGNNYDKLIAELIKIIPTLSQDTGKSSNDIHTQNNLTTVKEYLKKSVNLATNDSNEDENKLTRLTVILMLIISKKFNSILKKT